MTNEKILELAVDAFGIHYDRLDARFTNFARAVLAAGASEGQAEPIYQVRGKLSPDYGWDDMRKKDFDVLRTDLFDKRIVYTHPSAELTALRERIAGMEKDVQRYQWLKENSDVLLDEEVGFRCHVTDKLIFSRCPAACEFDDAIDAAIAKQDKEQS